MRFLWNRFFSFSLFVQVFIAFCLLGVITNFCWLYQDFASHSLLWRLHAGFFILYAAQVVFIFLKEKWVCILTFLQGFLALFTTANFIFTPLLRFLGGGYFLFYVPTVQGIKVYQYIFLSLAFTLQMFSAYALYKEFEQPPVDAPSLENSSI